MEDLSNEELNQKQTKNKHFLIVIISVVLVTILAVTTALLVKHYVITSFIVDGISMYPTLDGGNGSNIEGSSQEERSNGEILYLNKVSKISRGDIIVFSPQWEDLLDSEGNYKSLVKRVIAVAGDHLQIINNVVYLNGEILEETYINESMVTADIDITISDNCIFCMGDNRNHSVDCRKYGEVRLDTVVGKCWLIKGIDGKLRLPS